MSKLTILKAETADKLIKGDKVPKKSPQTTVGRPTGSKYIPESLLVEIVSSDGDGYYTVMRKILDNTDADTANHTWINSANETEFTAREITGATDATVGETYRIWASPTKQGKPLWLFQLGGGSSTALIRLNAVSQTTNANEWAGDVVSSRVATGGEVVEDVTIVAPHMDEGTLPLTGTPASRFWRANVVSNSELIPDAINAANPIPGTVYEINPPVFLGV